MQIFDLNSGDKIYSFYKGGSTTWRMKVRLRISGSISSLSQFNSIFEYSPNTTIENILPCEYLFILVTHKR